MGGGLGVLLAALDGLTEADLARTVTIRGEPHTAQQAILRALAHAAYHAGQILYLARLARPDAPWQTIPPGASASARWSIAGRSEAAAAIRIVSPRRPG